MKVTTLYTAASFNPDWNKFHLAYLRGFILRWMQTTASSSATLLTTTSPVNDAEIGSKDEFILGGVTQGHAFMPKNIKQIFYKGFCLFVYFYSLI